MKRAGFTEGECKWRAQRARQQLKTMSELNSSREERELTALAIDVWEERAKVAAVQKVWSHEYEPLAPEGEQAVNKQSER